MKNVSTNNGFLSRARPYNKGRRDPAPRDLFISVEQNILTERTTVINKFRPIVFCQVGLTYVNKINRGNSKQITFLIARGSFLIQSFKSRCIIVIELALRLFLWKLTIGFDRTFSVTQCCLERVWATGVTHRFLVSVSQVTELRETPSIMIESTVIAIILTTIFSILLITDIVGNSIVCALIQRNRDMR